MARIAIGGLHHETNSFAPQPATFERFVEADGWPPLLRGADLLPGCAGINLAITGFVDAARARHELVPLTWANACPSGPVTRDAFERLAGMILDELRAVGPVDGICLDLHGAMVTEHLEDGEGELLARVRAVAGAVPVVAALDLHANVSDAMVEHADALVAYRTYPHIDLAETGARCLPLLEHRMAGRALAKAHRKLDFLIPLPWQCTTIEPGRSLFALLGRPTGELDASICTGFPAADTSCSGPSVLAYATTPEAASRRAEDIARAFAAVEPEFAGELWEPSAAVAAAIRMARAGRVLLADTQDNPGGGGSGDTTGLLTALVDADARDTALALLADPTAAAAAHDIGIGQILTGFPLGGRHGPHGVAPVMADWLVVTLGDGRFSATGPMYRGSRMDLGRMALLRPLAAPGIDVLVSTRRLQAADRAIFHHLGVDPADKRILALKSSVHFRADFEPLASEVLIVRAPGANVADPAELSLARVPDARRRRPALTA